MSEDPRIICFRHCSSKTIFCKDVPNTCPLCQSPVQDYVIDPFRIPYPYTNAIHQPTTIVIKPSQGSFLNDYDINKDLHIGIVNSEGIIFEFDNVGLIRNNLLQWTNCIALKVVPSSWEFHWDDTLEMMLQDPKWTPENYDSVTMNCFNFVIDFLNNLNYTDLRVINKEDLCKKLILPKIVGTLRYNTLYRNLINNKYVIEK